MKSFAKTLALIALLQGCIVNVTLAMPRKQKLVAVWQPDLSLNPEPNYRNDALCAGMPDGFYAYGEQCTPDYYACVGGVFYSKTCSGGTVFDPAVDACVSPSTATCQATTTTTTKTTTVHPITCNEDGFYPLGPCSSSYYVCVGGDVYPEKCPPNGVFEPSVSACVSNTTAACASTAATTTTTQTTTPLGPFVCPASDGFYPAAPNMCDAKYFTCVNWVAYEQFCGIDNSDNAQRVFDPWRSGCVRPESCMVTAAPIKLDSVVIPVQGSLSWIDRVYNFAKGYVA